LAVFKAREALRSIPQTWCHDLAAARPFDDFDVNAGGTLNLLEAARRACPEAPFIHLSTNKVYGDAPNQLNLHFETCRRSKLIFRSGKSQRTWKRYSERFMMHG